MNKLTTKAFNLQDYTGREVEQDYKVYADGKITFKMNDVLFTIKNRETHTIEYKRGTEYTSFFDLDGEGWTDTLQKAIYVDGGYSEPSIESLVIRAARWVAKYI